MSEPRLIVSFSKDDISNHLCHVIVDICVNAIAARGAFTIALSGGSLPKFLAELTQVFDDKGVDPKLDCWHVILADERCVPSSDDDSNLKALNDELFSVLAVPKSQIHGIDESSLEDVDAVASAYESVVKLVLEKSGGILDLAVLGFGPDGHTCSLFPDHALLQETSKWVAGIADSPKPPPKRITLTLAVLCPEKTRHVIFCGAGSSKGPILRSVFQSLDKSTDEYAVPGGAVYKVTREDPPPYPCGMVTSSDSMTWIVDAEAMHQAKDAPSPY